LLYQYINFILDREKEKSQEI